jgi:hypothetical protein
MRSVNNVVCTDLAYQYGASSKRFGICLRLHHQGLLIETTLDDKDGDNFQNSGWNLHIANVLSSARSWLQRIQSLCGTIQMNDCRESSYYAEQHKQLVAENPVTMQSNTNNWLQRIQLLC